MTPRDCFAVGVRVIGLVVTIGGLRYLASAAMVAFHARPVQGVAPAMDYLIPGVLGVLAGLYLLRGAPHVVRFAYPPKKIEEQATPRV